MKKIYTYLLLLLIVISVSACTFIYGQGKEEIYGKVTKINNTEVTIEQGELSQKQPEDLPEKPSDENSGDSSTRPPEMMDGENNNERPPEPPDGDMPNNSNDSPKKSDANSSNSLSEPPEKPDGDRPNNSNESSEKLDRNSSDNSSESSERPDGNVSNNSSEPPVKSDGNSSNNSSKPSEEMDDSDKSTSNPPSNMPPEAPNSEDSFKSNGETKTYDLENVEIKEESGDEVKDSTIENIKVGSLIKLEIDSNQKVLEVTILNENSNAPGQEQIDQGSSANTINNSETISDKTYESSGDDENALRIDGGEVNLENVHINKNSGNSSNEDAGNFYGMNAALLVNNGATANINNCKVYSSAKNGNGIFSYGSGTTTNISNTEIKTEKDNSGGIQTTGGATTNATNLEVQTLGNSSAAIRSDRGGGNVNVSGGNYTSNGLNSPAIYSTANIKGENVNLKANNSESIVIEGKNSVDLTNCNITGNMSKLDGVSSSINVHNIMIYQTMSGDSDIGTATMNLKGGTLTGNSGDMFYITNTSCKINLDNVAITNQDSQALLMRVSGNNAKHGWGEAGSNGGKVDFSVTNQTLNGNIEVDSISTLNMTLSNNSSLTGSINIVDNEENGEAVENNAVVTVENGSTWNLTGDCKISSLTNNGTINYNGYHITLADGTVLG